MSEIPIIFSSITKMLKFIKAIIILGKKKFFVPYRFNQKSKIFSARVTPAFHLTPTYGTLPNLAVKAFYVLIFSPNTLCAYF